MIVGYMRASQQGAAAFLDYAGKRIASVREAIVGADQEDWPGLQCRCIGVERPVARAIPRLSR
ncbi:hypothetical protein ACMGDM_18820 [Sphingomonas sp. DT-51]|uniref:hypothetical protein n=1 Tax=Sphingomonas sp. DT-51 TaxID=3396165 RepID=UPI003F1B680B